MSVKLYTPAEAVEYLRKMRGILYSVDGLRNLRRRKRADAELKLGNNTLWTQEELDAIQPTPWTKRAPIEEKNNEDEQGDLSAMVLMRKSNPRQRHRHARRHPAPTSVLVTTVGV
jgi:hypothetical protein